MYWDYVNGEGSRMPVMFDSCVMFEKVKVITIGRKGYRNCWWHGCKRVGIYYAEVLPKVVVCGTAIPWLGYCWRTKRISVFLFIWYRYSHTSLLVLTSDTRDQNKLAIVLLILVDNTVWEQKIANRQTNNQTNKFDWYHA